MSSEGLNSAEGHGENSFVRLTAKVSVPFTVEFAKRHIDHEVFEGERKVSEERAEDLKKEMQYGRFRYETLTIVTAVLDGKEYRINGVHACIARTAFPENPNSEKVTWLQYAVGTLADLRDLYVNFGNSERRDPRMMFLAQLVGFKGWTEVSNKVMVLVGAAFKLWKWPNSEERYCKNHRDTAYLLKTEYLDLGCEVGKFLTEQEAESKHLQNNGAISAMFSTFEEDPVSAQEFWATVAHGLGIVELSDPRKKLRDKLLSWKNHGSDNDDRINRVCMAAWKNYRIS